MWTSDGNITALSSLPGEAGSSATAVNNRGTIAGYSFSPGTGETVARWAPDGTIYYPTGAFLQAVSPEGRPLWQASAGSQETGFAPPQAAGGWAAGLMAHAHCSPVEDYGRRRAVR